MRLPGRGPRCLHGQPWSRGRRRRRASTSRSRLSRTDMRRSTSRTFPSCWSARSATGRLQLHRPTSRGRRRDRALHLRRNAAAQGRERRRRLATSTRRSTASCGSLKPGDVVVGKSTVPVGTAARLADQVRGRQPDAHLMWNPEFLREGHAVADTLEPDRLVYGVRAGDAARERPSTCSTRSTPSMLAPGRPAAGHRPTHRRAGQDGRQLLPGHQDLLHQRDGRALRGRRRRRHRAGRRDRHRRAHRPQLPQRGARLRRRLPAQGHPGVHGPGRGARRRPGADLPARGRRDQHAAPGADGRPGPRGVRRLARRPADRSTRAPRSSRTATTSATRPRSTSRRRCSCRAPRSS